MGADPDQEAARVPVVRLSEERERQMVAELLRAKEALRSRPDRRPD